MPLWTNHSMVQHPGNSRLDQPAADRVTHFATYYVLLSYLLVFQPFRSFTRPSQETEARERAQSVSCPRCMYFYIYWPTIIETGSRSLRHLSRTVDINSRVSPSHRIISSNSDVCPVQQPSRMDSSQTL
jgi:hypothetical protein